MNSESDQNFPAIEGIKVSHRFIEIGDIKIHIAEAGEGEPLIMMHGWP